MEVDVREASARPERAGELAEIRGAVGEVMVGVHDERQVAARRRQQRVVVQREYGRHVPHARLREPLPEDREDPRLGLDGEDAPPWSHRAGEPEREIAGAGADLAHGLAATQAEQADDATRTLPPRAVRRLHAREKGAEILPVAVVAMGMARPGGHHESPWRRASASMRPNPMNSSNSGSVTSRAARSASTSPPTRNSARVSRTARYAA